MSLRERIVGYFQEESAEDRQKTRQAYVDATLWELHHEGIDLDGELLAGVRDATKTHSERLAVLDKHNIVVPPNKLEVLLDLDMEPSEGGLIFADNAEYLSFSPTGYEFKRQSGEVDEKIRKHQEAISQSLVPDQIDIEC